ncbi:hypothetical protein N7508_008037 [Penicillium antarcticum]|uniref:uncharacterized protein n=1 Tax=Penicillium antarcticum TaxID=416450 RepID=UPI00239AB2B7|nr:uncharacterized protein N7508_008037 [Penicillium antarcticum]KAJ5297788.1 hypothetical protein N7508_008037 [Penicillium antarcticum]
MSNFPSLISFGSLSTKPSVEELGELRDFLLKYEHFGLVKEAISELPGLWKTLLANDAALEPLNGLAAAECLAAWVSTREAISTNDAPWGNILSLPLTIASHLCDYLRYVRETGSSHSILLEHIAKAAGVQGFCAGLLSALAIATSTDEKSVGVNGALSVRVAFAIGAYVDLDSLKHGSTSCLGVRWKSPNSVVDLQNILKRYDQAYISVIRSATEATITVPSSTNPELSRTLSKFGICVIDTGLRGRYHTSAHRGVPEKVIQSCTQHARVGSRKQHDVRSDSDDQILSQHNGLMAASREILVTCSNWNLALSKTASRLSEMREVAFALAIGTDTVLSSLSRNVKIVGLSSRCKTEAASEPAESLQDYPAHSIAITGMSCKLPGADSPNEFWELLLKGTSMVEHVPPERWLETVSSRGSRTKEKPWGNFMRDVDAFDHKFFNKSAREAASMDPQQRLLLQGAYEAMESAGYFSPSLHSRAHDIGCYLGLCAVEYDANVASHSPNAFSTLGTLRAFLSGKISHFFGWTGPSLTFDTACSSSAVAIHTACRALQTNECTQALAGGVSLFTSPYLYENLSASHFLSPTGASKPFDAKADGYCRGEGFGLVVLKKLSAAVADGDNILAVIGSSAVNQNDNSVPITVPNASSQETLYRKAAQQAGIQSHQVSFVESHGTGTSVGDPIEMESIRNAFGGPQRQNHLVVSSVKGNIGHLEGASGVAGLIKAILQLEHRTAVRQASFQSLNPRISPLGPDRITVPTANLSLQDDLLTACVNNYGAAGSNCALIIAQPPRISERPTDLVSLSKYPILIAANSEVSLEKYCRALKEDLQNQPDKRPLISSVAFHLARRHNGSLPYMYTTAVSDTKNLETQLIRQLSGSPSSIHQRPSRPSMILVCGGQVRKYVGLSQHLWDKFTLLRMYLDACDKIVRSMGYPGIYPAIFQSEPIADIVTLHSALFALQYASAKAWVDCGLAIDAVIGHSLGQLTALSVSGILSLEDGLKFVAGRASLIKTHWGTEAGSMILVEADQETLSNIRHSLEVACYNGHSSHVLVGDKASMNEFEEIITRKSLKYKRLQVTNGFHSKFTEPLIAPLRKLASTLHFNKPAIPIETCSDGSSWLDPNADCLAEHTRKPVFFAQAAQRLASTRGICTWLEAGSESGVASMARRALDSSTSKAHTFLPISLSKPSDVDLIVDTTIQLWKVGHTSQFWAFHRVQSNQYHPLRVPPYQWEKNKHWLELLPPSPSTAAGQSSVSAAPEPRAPHLVSQIEQHDEEFIFKIDPLCKEYQEFVSGHVIAGSPLCPATVYMEIVARACKMLVPWKPTLLLGFSQLQIYSPLGMAADRNITMILRVRSEGSWEFNIMSYAGNTEQSKKVSHTSGIIELQSNAGTVEREFSRYERLICPETVEKLYEDADSESVRGSMLYQVFSRVVQYSGPYRGLKSVAAKMGHIAGKVTSSPEFISDTVIAHPAVVDSWMQIAGIHANGIRPCPEDEVYVFTKLERMQFGPEFTKPSPTFPSSWIIFSNLVPTESKELLNDIFVFDADSKRLVVLILGAQFNNVRLSTLQKVLSRLNTEPRDVHQTPNHSQQTTILTPSSSATDCRAPLLPAPEPDVSRSGPPVDRDDVLNNVCACLERVAEIPRLDIKGNASMDDLGIDSLMMMEVISELSSHCNIELPIKDMEQLTTLDSLVNYIQNKEWGAQRGDDSSSDISTTVISQPTSPSIDTPDTTPNSEVPPPCDRHDSQRIEQLASLLQGVLDTPSAPSGDANLAQMGLDSLQAIELGNEIEKVFSVSIDMHQLDDTSTFQDLARMAGLVQKCLQNSAGSSGTAGGHSNSQRHQEDPPQQSGAVDVRETFDKIRYDFDELAKEEGFANFWRDVHPDQNRLVLAYTANSFRKLGADLAYIPAGQVVPEMPILEKYKPLLERMHTILAGGGYIDGEQSLGYKRTSKPFVLDAPQTLLMGIISDFPLHASEHQLLDVTGSQLAECLTGKIDPLALLFANKKTRQIVAEVYDQAPMCRATTRLVERFMARAFPPSNKGEVFHFLEVGGGTGGTTRFLVENLTRRGVKFTYTFTDISSALVESVKKVLAGHDCMRYATLDVEKDPPLQFKGKYHAIISTNCIHATRNATASLENLRRMLLADGVLALVEFTNGLYWFDLVYGLLDGWWIFDDGRRHALADVSFWERSLTAAGFNHVKWTDGDTAESRTLRLICGFNSTSDSGKKGHLSKRAGIALETVTWKRTNGLELCADIYYPSPEAKDTVRSGRPIALLFHGGGHVLLTRKDIHMKHIKTLLDRGFLPISVDYRLCPEVNLSQGPMTDACDALAWAKSQLPDLDRARSDVHLDSNRVAAIGWSSGGQLAMTLAYTAPKRGLQPPNTVLAFYCPSNFEADCWKSPIYPRSIPEASDTEYNLLEGVYDSPTTGYKPAPTSGGQMSLTDPRWRIVIHYNWKAQLVPVLVRGLPSKAQATPNSMHAKNSEDWKQLPMPPVEEIRAVSPYAQILRGQYRTPTFLVHGDNDELIPWQQSRDTVQALVSQNVEAGFAAPHGAGHAFDLWPDEDPQETGWPAVNDAYDFVCRHVLQ